MEREITEEEASEMLIKDLRQARRDAESLFDNALNEKGAFGRLNQAKQEILTDHVFNVGVYSLAEKRDFMMALKNNNFEAAKAGCQRRFRDSKRNWQNLDRRRDALIQTYFESGLIREGAVI